MYSALPTPICMMMLSHQLIFLLQMLQIWAPSPPIKLSKFYKVKNDLILVKNNWKMSGNRGSTIVQNVDKNELDAQEIEIFECK
jgi:hypothetical protein